MLRFELIPIAQLDRDFLIQNAYTAFLCPAADASSRDWAISPYSNGSTNGAIVNGNCNEAVGSSPSLEPDYCNVEITNLDSLNGGLGEASFFIDLQSIYNPVTTYISVYGSGSQLTTANRLDIAGAQTLIDSTGKAQDVLRRIQVGVPSRNSYYIPDGTTASGDICKQLQVAPGATQSSANCSILP